MSATSTRSRKALYLGGILVLLVPIFLLGMPADRDPKSRQPTGGGKLAQLRHAYDLGASDLGEIDPASAAMNLALLGLRGIAANQLWQNLEHERDTKNWAQMRQTTDNIIRLQPHFVDVWRFNGWNLAYNVSAEWDNVRDRYYWVKEGGKFLMRGTKQNAKTPNLPWEVGRIWGQKIGNADERRFFRKFFVRDPDEKFRKADGEEMPDPEINPDQLDNFLVARRWFSDGCERELNARNTIMDRTLFRAYPTRSLFDYCVALQRDGIFGEKTRLAWQQSFEEWTKDYGQYHFVVPELKGRELWFSMSDEEIADASRGADGQVDEELEESLRKWLNQYQNIGNFRYWRARARCESESDTAKAHEIGYNAIKEYRAGNFRTARDLCFQAMGLFQNMLDLYPDLVLTDDQFGEEAISLVIVWKRCYQFIPDGGVPPEEFPLAKMYNQIAANPAAYQTIEMRLDGQMLLADDDAADRKSKK